jgi:hypothetical protein
MLQNLTRLAAAAGLALLAACATPAEPGRMVVAPGAGVRPFPAAFSAAICVRTVEGGQETNPLLMSQVDDRAFRFALEESLRENGLLGRTCRYQADANLLSLMQPMFGLDLRVTALVNYKLEDNAGAPLLRETIASAFTATFSDSAIAIMRLKIANEGAIRASISDFLGRIRDLTPK